MTFEIRLFEGFIRFYCNKQWCKLHGQEGLCKIAYDFIPEFKCPYDALKK